MTDTIPAQLTGLQAIWAAATGVKTSFKDAPDSLANDQLPAVVNFPMRSEIDWDSEDEAGKNGIETRDWECRLYIALRGISVSGGTVNACSPFFDRGRDAIESHFTLNQTPGVIDVTLLGDDGLNWAKLTYVGQQGNDVKYAGIVFRVRIKTRVRTNYVPGG